MTIFSYTSAHKQEFCQLLLEYFPQVGADVAEKAIRGKLLDMIDHQFSEGILSIALLSIEDHLAGFSIYQIDRPESDWCKRPGWGFIREFYVRPSYRHRGLGKAMAAYTESQLFAQGARELYLTADNAISFWQSCGWQLTSEECSNDCPILEKSGIDKSIPVTMRKIESKAVTKTDLAVWSHREPGMVETWQNAVIVSHPFRAGVSPKPCASRGFRAGYVSA